MKTRLKLINIPNIEFSAYTNIYKTLCISVCRFHSKFKVNI